MSRAILSLTCAIGLAASAAAQQSTSSPQQPSEGQQKQSTSTQGAGKTVTLTGCVVQSSDQPTVFALRQMDMQTQQTTQGTQGTQSTQSPQSGQSAQAGQSGQAGQAGQAGQTAQAGQAGQAGTAGTSGAAGQAGGWYRLAPEGAQDLKQYTGQAVRVTGTMTPGKDEKGADVVVHRITPDKVTITAIDLQPAPQLRIQSIAKATGTCGSASGTGQ